MSVFQIMILVSIGEIIVSIPVIIWAIRQK